MNRRIRRSASGFLALAGLVLLAIPAGAVDSSPGARGVPKSARERDSAAQSEAQEQVETGSDPAAAPSGPSAAAIVFDCLILRPFGLAATLLGGVFFVPAAVLASPSGPPGVKDAWETFVANQVQNTFQRPLGADF